MYRKPPSTKKDNIELIFINDASTDNRLEILKHYQAVNHNMCIIDLKENLRQGRARNQGIKLAKGKYIGFVDADDMVLSDMYQTLFDVAEKSEADVVFIEYGSINESDGIGSVRIPKPLFRWNSRLLDLNKSSKEGGLTDKDREYLMAYPIGGVYCGLYRNSFIKGLGFSFPEHLRYEDNYWITLMKCRINKVRFIEEVKYLYRHNNNSTIYKRNDSYQYEDRIQFEHMLLEEAQVGGVLNKYYSVFEYIYVSRFIIGTVSILLHNFDVVQYTLIHKLVQDLSRVFPNWRHNPFYREMYTTKQKIKNEIMLQFPRLFFMIEKISEIIHLNRSRRKE